MANEQRQQGRPNGGQQAPASIATTTISTGPPASASSPQKEPMPPLATRKGWEEQVQEFLWEKGWKPTGYDHDEQVLWDDPRGSNEAGEMKYSHSTKDESGNVTDVKQYYAPPIPWSHRTAEAYGIQRARDQWEADAPKREAEARRREAQVQEYKQMLAAKRARRAGVLA